MSHRCGKWVAGFVDQARVRIDVSWNCTVSVFTLLMSLCSVGSHRPPLAPEATGSCFIVPTFEQGRVGGVHNLLKKGIDSEIALNSTEGMGRD